MDVACANCGRRFQLDDGRVVKLSAAKCLCGARVQLQVDPNRLGKYILVNRIAIGGMGEIYYAKIPGVEGFEREVVIKKMLPHLSADRNFINMMIKEAKLTVLLNHPNIVQVYDLAKEGDKYYIAMEYVEGINVGTLLESCRRAGVLLPVQVAAHISLQVLRGLAYAHELRGPDGEPMNVLHRDITPQNILCTRAGWVKITDFGIAKARNEISTTSPGMIKGKLGYIAPEQLEGKDGDQRVDIFCAGILLWESLACRRLFKGATEIDTFRLIAEARVPPLSEIRPDVPAEIEKVIHKALARDRDARYGSCDEFYNGLNQALFPTSADDCRNATLAFFEKQAAFFKSVDAHKEVGADGTVQLDISKDHELPTISELLSLPASEPGRRRTSDRFAPEDVAGGGGRRFSLALVVVALMLATTGAIAWSMRDRLIGDAAPESGAPPAMTLEEVQLALEGESLRLQECYKLGSRDFKKLDKLGAELVIPQTGGVAEVRFDAAAELLGRAAPCLDQVVRSLRFRRHSLPRFQARVTLPAPSATAQVAVSGTGGGGGNGGDDDAGLARRVLSSEEISSVVRRHHPSIGKCWDKVDAKSAPPKIEAQINVDAAGRVAKVSLAPAIGDAEVEQCLVRTLKAMRFRKNPGIQFALPLILVR